MSKKNFFAKNSIFIKERQEQKISTIKKTHFLFACFQLKFIIPFVLLSLAISVFLLVAVGVMSWSSLNIGFLCALAGFGILAFMLAGKIHSTIAVYSLIIIGSFLLCVFSIEAFFKVHSYLDTSIRVSVGDNSENTNMNRQDPVCGYAYYKKKCETIARREYRGKPIYYVTYGFNENGNRVTPENTATAKRYVITFGCSFTFGEGVSDTETFPWQLSMKLGTNYQVNNLGVEGYGPHQMLAIIESGRADAIIRKGKTLCFFLTISDHPKRVAGLHSWNDGGEPRYVLKDASVVCDGALPQLWPPVFDALSCFWKYSLHETLLQRKYRINSEIIYQTYCEVLKRSAMLLREKGADLIIINWENDVKLKAFLDSNGISSISMKDIIPHLTDEADKWLIPHDGHPNDLAYERLANYLRSVVENYFNGKNQK